MKQEKEEDNELELEEEMNKMKAERVVEIGKVLRRNSKKGIPKRIKKASKRQSDKLNSRDTDTEQGNGLTGQDMMNMTDMQEDDEDYYSTEEGGDDVIIEKEEEKEEEEEEVENEEGEEESANEDTDEREENRKKEQEEAAEVQKENSENEKEEGKCPGCRKVVRSGVECGDCRKWWHFNCQGMTQQEVHINYEDRDYICTECSTTQKNRDMKRQIEDLKEKGQKEKSRVERLLDGKSKMTHDIREKRSRLNELKEEEQRWEKEKKELKKTISEMKKKISDLTKTLNNLSVKSKNQSQIEEQKEKAGWCGSMKRKIEDTLGKKTTDGMVTETVQGVEEVIEELITKFKVVKEEARKKGRETEKQRKETAQTIGKRTYKIEKSKNNIFNKKRANVVP